MLGGRGSVVEELNPNRARDHLANERTFLAWCGRRWRLSFSDLQLDDSQLRCGS
jgi:hypothetical protein